MFLIRTEFRRPAEMDDAAFASLQHKESHRATQLQESGVVTQLWREPGTSVTWGLWHAPTEDDVRAQLASLPAFAAMTVEVREVVTHPNAIPSAAASSNRLYLSPAVRALGRAHDLDLRALTGSGSGGRVTLRDAQAELTRRAALPAPAGSTGATSLSVVEVDVTHHVTTMDDSATRARRLMALVQTATRGALLTHPALRSQTDVHEVLLATAATVVDGVVLQAPAVRAPQVAALGLGAATQRPVVRPDVDGQAAIAIRWVVQVSLTYDDQSVSAEQAAAFLSAVSVGLGLTPTPAPADTWRGWVPGSSS